ncbi:SRPBCC family protein [Mesobacillus foraminis]|uniref:SRPBCC family protein n=1 Tax=Mesobacillus foraminis TaxID=279826 RepID=UPI001BE6FBEE|nr:SRPBCC family protein [Mesobacillus foraminis]MBT2757697.1 SRPBCC family protein [Mesobacillus foraminis]
MNTKITTKFKIHKPTHEVFEAIVDPRRIGNYWFSSSSERWEQGKTITLRYEEYEAEGVIQVLEIVENKKIVFSWGSENDEETVVSISLKESENHTYTIIEVNESGFKEDEPDVVTKMLGQKEGWVFMLSCLKAYLENGITDMRGSLIH